MPAKFITKAMKAFRGEKNNQVPVFVIPIKSDQKVDRIKELVSQELKAVGFSNRKIEELTSRIIKADTYSYNWQQDYFESFYDLLQDNRLLGTLKPMAEPFTQAGPQPLQ